MTLIKPMGHVAIFSFAARYTAMMPLTTEIHSNTETEYPNTLKAVWNQFKEGNYKLKMKN